MPTVTTISVPPLTGSTVRLVGSFNPAIFQPAWFSRESLISNEEADAATINIIHSQISSFETPAFAVEVTPDWFDVTAAGRPFTDLVRDLAYGTFSILQHTPISAMGMNNFVHFQAKSEQSWHTIGHRFAPKEFWNPLLERPGMQSLTIRGQRDDDLVGWIDVRVEPSVQVVPHGVFVYVNDHVQVKPEDITDGAVILMDALRANWDKAVERANRIINAVRKEAS
jgi:hypothetical protein